MKKHDEELFDQLIRHAAGEWIDELTDEYPPVHELPEDLTFSPGFTAWADQLTKREEMRSRRRLLNHRLQKTGKRVVIVACILIAVCSLAAFSIPPVRVALTNWLLDQNDDYYGLSVGQAGDKDASSILGYIPDGFSPASIMDNEAGLIIVLEDSAHVTVVFERHNGKMNYTVDSEASDFKPVQIGDLSGYYSDKNGKSRLVFNDSEYSYVIESEIGKNELIKIAEGIKR